MTANEAREFVIGRMLDEARRQGAVLTDVERKMLYFSEVNPPPSIPDYMDAAAAMDAEKPKDPRNYCTRSDEYETEMAALLVAARESDEKQSAKSAARWRQAIKAIESEDHYLGVILMEAEEGRPDPARIPIRNRFFWTLTVIIVLIGIMFWIARIRNP